MFSLLRKIFFEHAVITTALLYISILLLFPPYFNGYDNIFFTHALMWGEPSVHTVCISYYLMYPLSWIAAFKPAFDPFTVFVFALNGISLVLVARLLIQTKAQPQLSHYCGWLLVILLTYMPILYFEFAIASSFSMAAGLLLLLKTSRKKKIVLSLIASLYILVAASLRFDSCLVLLPLIGLAAAIEFIRGNKAFMLYSSVVAMGILIINTTQSHYTTADFWGNEEMNLTIVHTSRCSLVDYKDISSSDFQKKKEAQYDAIGFTAPVRKLFFAWQFNAPLRGDNAWWEKIEKIRMSHDYTPLELQKVRLERALQSGRAFISPLLHFYYIIVLLYVAAVVIVITFWQHRVIHAVKKCAPFLLYTSLFFALFALLCYGGRINLTAYLSVFYVCFPLCVLSIKEMSFSIDHRFLRLASYSCLFIVSIFIPYTQRKTIIKLFSPLEASYSYPSITQYLEKQMQQNPEMLYFAPAQLYRRLAVPSNLLLSENIDRMERFLPMGDWESCLPFYEQRLQRMGVENDLSLVTMKNARFVLTQKLEPRSGLQLLIDFYRDYYQIKLKAVLDSQLNDECFIYRVESQS